METINLFDSVSTGAMTKQEGLNQVVQNKVEAMLRNHTTNVQETMQRLEQEGRMQADYIAPLGVNLQDRGQRQAITFANDENVQMVLNDTYYNLHDNAVGQLAERMGVPSRYLRNLAGGKEEWQRNLAAHLLNEHTNWTERSRVLVRTVGEQVRAVLSDSYRRLNSVEILTAFVKEATDQGAVISDAYMNDTKVWAETLLPIPIEIPTAKNGMVLLYAGARLSTSDYGDGSVDIRAFLMNGVCLNGMVRESVMRQVHLGSRLPDSLALSQRTYELDTKTTVSAVKDLTSGLFSKDDLTKKAIEIQRAASTEVDFTQELRRLTSKGALLKSEGEEVQKILMRNNPEDGVQGESTLWKLTQGITAHARELSPERSRELHEISGALLERVKEN